MLLENPGHRNQLGALDVESENYFARIVLQESLRLSGEFEESVAVGELTMAMSGRHPWAMMFRALTLADWGKNEAADAVYCEMLDRARHQYVSPATLAVTASAAARETDAVRQAHEAFETRDPHCQFFWSRFLTASARLYAYTGFREIIALMGRSEWVRN
jgi:hypothetical protein